ncbi:MAG: 16S rRNA (cytosine(1402)-N(4))-methyltransferase RsmH [Candidatus Pacebacteria bacterium]|nr:16S rRNA (cytosine(1402)-N(4))-methyltransferase RsmH [Candidatus Paceibacterota bacterium]
MHISVLLNEAIGYLGPKPNENFMDCTLGFGGHTKAILEKVKPNGRVLGIEWDKDIFEQVKKENIERLVLINDSYANLKNIVQKEKFGPVNGILFDIGISSFHIDSSNRGFSFQKNEELDMRFSQSQCLTAKEIINKWPEQDLAEIFKEYGQERFARNIASNIARIRKLSPIETTFELIEVIRKSFPKSYKFGKVHFATRTFQALRIAVNGELENLKAALPQALEILQKGGRIAVISFHSLEDGIVKRFFKENSKNGILQILTKKPSIPALLEIKNNPKARSAKLRAAIKI